MFIISLDNTISDPVIDLTYEKSSSAHESTVRVLCCVDIAAAEPRIALKYVGNSTEFPVINETTNSNKHQFCHSGFLEATATLPVRGTFECTVTDSSGCYFVDKVMNGTVTGRYWLVITKQKL